MATSNRTALPDPTTTPQQDPFENDTDIVWLISRVAARIRLEFDHVARDAGLGDTREWVVLNALTEGPLRNQLELGRLLGVDKTTLIAILDRMERRGLIVRLADPNDRRVRIPQATEAGLKLHRTVARAHERKRADLLAGVSPKDQERFRQVLLKLSDG